MSQRLVGLQLLWFLAIRLNFSLVRILLGARGDDFRLNFMTRWFSW